MWSASCARSLPSRERGLKSVTRVKNALCLVVAPFAGAWIEIYSAVCDVQRALQSLPSRERGLKFDVDIAIRGYGCVAPFAGAWIEILVLYLLYYAKWSLPSRERGLKSVLFLEARMRLESLPSRERGLKFHPDRRHLRYCASLPSRSDGDSRTTILPPNLAPVPHPHNLSPTPTKTFAHVMTHVL